jgi:hypothetical protein
LFVFLRLVRCEVFFPAHRRACMVALCSRDRPELSC